MNNQDIVLEYYKHNSLDGKTPTYRIGDLSNLFSHLVIKGLVKKDVDEELMRFIIDIICLDQENDQESLMFKAYLSHYMIYTIRDAMGSEKIEIPKEKEVIKVEYDHETIDVKPEDVPDKKYDLDFLKKIGLENPDDY